jgi:hypothetical protein
MFNNFKGTVSKYLSVHFFKPHGVVTVLLPGKVIWKKIRVALQKSLLGQ